MEGTNVFKNIIISNPYRDLGKYEAAVIRAKQAGVTHVSVSCPGEKSRWELDDPDDPYLNWSIIHNSLFKVIVPEVLAAWVPPEYAARNLQLIKERCRIIKKHGLKASFLAYEPMWWPESVFAQHPHLRGPRVDHPRRSRHPRFSPDLFHDEVLALYTAALRRLVTEVPELALFIFSTNDSSTGLSWADLLYNSANGPDRGFVPLGANVAKFLAQCEQAAPDRQFFIRGKVSDYELESLRQHLQGADGVVKMAFFGLKPFKEEAIQGLLTIPIYPVRDIGQPFSLMRNLIEARNKGDYGVILNPWAEAYVTEWDLDSLDFETLRYFQTEQPKSDFEIYQALAGMMNEIYGSAWGSRMLQAHSYLDRARTIYSPMEGGGTLLLLWVVAQRWLTRPLVAFPERLTAAEKAHFRPFQFQALTEAEADNPLEAQGYQMVKGLPQGVFFGKLLTACRGLIGQAIAEVADPAAPPPVVDFVNKLRCWDILLKTCFHFIRFYTLLETVKGNLPRDADGNPQAPHEMNLTGVAGDPDRAALYQLLRAELDNVDALIGLLRRADPLPLILVDRADAEDVFGLSPDLISQLERKKQLMLDHWLDLNQLLRCPNL